MKKNLSILILVMGILSSCAPTRVVVETNKYEDFKLSSYTTFDFAQIDTPSDSLVPYQQIVDSLKVKITQAMEARGHQRATSDASLKINLGLVVADKVQKRETNVSSDPFTYSGTRSYYWEVREIPVNTYREGSLTVHFVSNPGNILLWAGSISEVVPKKEEEKMAAVQDAVDQIFKYIDLNNK